MSGCVFTGPGSYKVVTESGAATKGEMECWVEASDIEGWFNLFANEESFRAGDQPMICMPESWLRDIVVEKLEGPGHAA